MNYEVILPNGDRAEAETRSSLLLAAATLIDEAATTYGSMNRLRKQTYVTENGVYSNQLTQLVQRGVRAV